VKIESQVLKLMELENDFMENLYDYGILFWYCKVQEQMNENVLIFQLYGPIDQHGFSVEPN